MARMHNFSAKLFKISAEALVSIITGIDEGRGHNRAGYIKFHYRTVNHSEEPAASIWRQLSRSAGVPLTSVVIRR